MIVRQVILDLWLYSNKIHEDSIFGSYVLESRPSTEFQYEAAKNKLINLEFTSSQESPILFLTPGDFFVREAVHGEYHHDSGTGRHCRLLRLAGRMDLDSNLTVS